MRWLLDLLTATLPAVEVAGDRLDPRVRALLWLGELRPSIATYSPAEARQQARKRQRMLPVPKVDLDVEDLHAAGLPMRRYTPANPAGAALLYFHGGGFVIGGLDSHDLLCRLLARDSGVEVIAVDYRLAPEHVFPAAVDDAQAAWDWFVQQPYRRHLVGGDSAGANLAAMLAHTRRPDGQLLIYPATDRHNHRPSRDTYARGFLYTTAMSTWFKDHYLPPRVDRRDPLVSPIFFEELSGQCPAHVLIAGFDILRDEGEAYVERLREAGVPVTVQLERSLPHGFIALLGAIPTGQEAVRTAAQALRRLAG